MSAPSWVEAIVRCINRRNPVVGFSEVSSYTSHVLTHHRAAYAIQPTKTWARNPTSSAGWAALRGRDGFCCNVEGMLQVEKAGERSLAYLGVELGHGPSKDFPMPSAERFTCGYREPVFLYNSSYPPADHVFWAKRGGAKRG